MLEVIPAIIPQDIYDLKDKMAIVEGIASIVQIDVCDGIFVPSKSWPYKNDYDGDFQKFVKEEEGFPFWDKIYFEVDLMVKEPEKIVEDWIKVGAKRIVLHFESTKNILGLLRLLRENYGYFGDSILNIEIGIAIGMKTPNSAIYEFLEPNADGRTLVDFVQFMGIREIGFQGQLFAEDVLGKIKDMRHKYPDAILSIDGGVNLDTLPSIVEAGITRVVSGSAIYESGDIKGTIEEMRKM
jgi:ribulose-phosphate 3-epimerase